MGTNADRWERRPVLAAITGPSRAGLDWIRRHLARHPLVACPESASRFWETAYGVSKGIRGKHWSQAFFGISGRIRCDVDPSMAALPSWKWGAVAAHHPSIRVLYVARNPIDLSWEALKAACEGHADAAVQAAEALDGADLGYRLRSQADYATHLAVLRGQLARSQVMVLSFEDLVADRQGTLDRIFRDVLRISPRPVIADNSPLNPPIDSLLPDEPPSVIAARLHELHRDQVESFAQLLPRAG